ncbi:MAG: hypothetical protein GX428_11500 [Candidatus Atribacteria bacterium]|nr:hypothetical protein [Candidatus Atribacteria bacterium]
MVIEALTQIGWDCYQLNVDVPLVELVPSLSNQNANFVYNLAVCSAEAYDQAFLPTLLDALNIPYLGSNSTIHSLCLDRALTKLSLRGIGIPTTSSIQWSSGDSLPDSLDYPYIIKSRFRSYCQRVSSDSIVNDQESLLKKAEEIFNQTGEKVLIEKFVEGREMVIGLWGNGNNPEVLPIMELNLSREKPLYDAEIESKKGYVDDISCPAKLSDEHKTMLENMAIKIFRELNLKDFATFHLIFDQKENLPLFFEINALPLLHYKHSAFPEMCSHHGVDYPIMVQKLLQIALERKKHERS